jgi:serine/threonine-protein kinase
MSALGTERWRRASSYLDRALDLPPSECDAYLVSLRAANPDVARDVDALLAEHRVLSAEGFLDSPAAIHRPEPALLGVTIGAYTLLSPIGHGGMGSVWLAARSDGRFDGYAALKLLNAALVGRAGEERFKREGTILARLKHQHIGRLIDAGVSSTGQPYLVLEHIVGRHIDRYCDDERLGIEDASGCFSASSRPSRTRTPISSSIAISNRRMSWSRRPARSSCSISASPNCSRATTHLRPRS